MKTIKKIACVLITALLVLATGVTGLSHGFTASADDGCTIIITNAKEGETYSVYKIFDVSVSDDKSAYSYKVDDSWKDFITNHTYKAGNVDVKLFTLSDGGYLLSSSAVFKLGEDSDDVLIAFATAAEAYAADNGIEASKTAIYETGTDSVKIGGLTPGWYLVTGTASSTICMLETVTSEATIEDKVGTPTLKKEILEDNGSTTNKETAENKETVEYQITLSGVYGVSDLVLHDALPDGGGLTLDEGSIIVTLYADETDTEGTTLTEGTDYTVSTVGCTDAPFSSDYSCFFEIDFSYSYNTIIKKGSSACIVITYTCTVDTTKGTYTGDVESLINEAVASYGENNSWTTKGAAEVDTFEFKILKTNSSGTSLEGAGFTLQNSSGQYAVFTGGDDGVYVFSEWVDTESDATTLVSGSDGKILVQGMNTGTYTLTETKAPEGGYNLLEDLLTVTIGFDDGDYILMLDGSKVYDHTITVVNNTGSMLPGTGGIGTTIFYIVGGVIIIVAVVLLVTRRRVGAKNDK